MALSYMKRQKVKQQKIMVRHKHCQWDCPIHNQFAKQLRKYRCLSSDSPCIQHSPSAIITKKYENKTTKKKPERPIATSHREVGDSNRYINKPDQLQKMIRVYMMRIKTSTQQNQQIKKDEINKEKQYQRDIGTDDLPTIKNQMQQLPIYNQTIDIKPFIYHKEQAQGVNGNQEDLGQQWEQMEEIGDEELSKNQITSLNQQVEALKHNVYKIEEALKGKSSESINQKSAIVGLDPIRRDLCSSSLKLSKSRYIEKLPHNQNMNKSIPQQGLNYKMYQDQRSNYKTERPK